jgi:hypothetical protein
LDDPIVDMNYGRIVVATGSRLQLPNSSPLYAWLAKL